MLGIQIQLLPGAKVPTKATSEAAGYDLCAFETKNIQLPPGERVCINTGLKVEIPGGYYGRIAPRSGIALKNGIDVLAGVIDSDYRGIIGVILLNTGKEPFEIKPFDRIAQIIFEKRYIAEFNEVSTLSTSARTGGFGSTGGN